MANGIDVKVGVSGLSQFKNNMNQAKSAVKTLDAQLALTEKQFKQSGDAESYMTEKAELLKAKLEQQKSVAENAQKALDDMASRGIDKASKSYQDMYRQMIQAKGNMLDTETQLDNIGKAADDADVSVRDMSSDLGKIGKNVSIENVSEALGKITDGMESAMKKAADLGRRLWNLTLGGAAWADELQTTATQFGIDAVELQKMQKTADIIDVSAETILQAKQKLNKVIGNDLLNDGTGVAEMLEALGLDNVVSTDAEERFWQIGDAIMKMGDESIQEAAATKLLGKSWRELVPLFEAGREEYNKIKESWSVVDQEQLDSLQKMDDEYQKLENEFETLQHQFEATFAQALTPVLETVTGLLEEFNTYLASEDGKKMLEDLSTAVASLFTDLTKITPEDVINNVIDVINKIKDGLNWIKDNSGLVVDGVKAFIGAWAALKTAEGVTTVLQLINGIKGLGSAGSAAAAGTAAGTSWGSAFASAVLKAVPWITGAGVLFENAFKPQGNDDLWDENGNPTALGLSQGITWTQDEDAEMANRNRTNPAATGTNSDGERTVKRYESVKALERLQEAAEDLTGTSDAQKQSSTEMTKAADSMKDLPDKVEEAVRNGMTGMNVYMDGEKVGELVAPVVSGAFAGVVLAVTK